MSVKYFTLIFSVFMFFEAFSQSPNIDFANAFTIPDPIEWCSESGEFNSTNAGGSEYTADGCFSGVENDMWFEFVAFAKAINIVINGDAGSLNNPRVVLYTGFCGGELTEIRCESNDGGPDIVNLFRGGLTIGETYYIRVGGENDNQGSFQLCINGYNPPVDPGQDATSASVLCDKSTFVVQVLSGGGSNPDEAAGTCLDVGFGDTENQSTWFTWVAANDGTLSFSINPINPTDDLDWVVYEFPNGPGNSTGKIELRCMASSCIGPTGLRESSNDFVEQPGCSATDDNFLKALDQEENKTYGILINNFSESGVGFEMEFSGDAEFQGPRPDFSITIADGSDPTSGLTCDKLFDALGEDNLGTGVITNYDWNFGEGAVPQTANGAGPHTVNYETFGEKYVVLTVTSDLGCIVTAVEQVFAAPCCADVDAIDIEIESLRAVGCEGEENGALTLRGTGVFPDYYFSFEGERFTPLSSFNNLEAGDYDIAIEDRKGCTTVRTFTIPIASPIDVDAGEDTEVEFLGDNIQLDGSFMADGNVSFEWEPSDFVNCGDGTTNCLDPIVTPPGTTDFIIIMTDENGCTTKDTVQVRVLNTRPVYAPNVFSPNEDGINDNFYLIGSSLSVLSIKDFVIFDRWGNKVFTANNLAPSDPNAGWDGRFNGTPVETGVYTWFAKVIYLDTQSEDGDAISGEITVLR